ncbi:MAG: hypothetical protein Q9179_001175 [Wetmoreana sp. 5 TL-2023]
MAKSGTDKVHTLLENYIVQNCDNADFLPQQDLLDNLTREHIEIVLRECDLKPHLIADIVEQVLRGAHKTFAILILSKCVARIQGFIKFANPHGSPLDGKLPYEHIKSLVKFGLNEEERKRFFKNQWKVAAPVFDFNSVLPVFLHDKTHLPFQPIDDEHTLLGRGGFGEVHRVVIHPRHQKVQIEIVRKEMSGPESPNDFERELTSMSILKQIRHPNIIQLLAAYSYHDKYHLVFPRAQGGSLKRLLDGAIPPMGLDSTETMMVAVAGLSSAICAMHDLSFDSTSLIGCHRDLKPDNILLNNSDLLLADFGLSRFKPSDESSRSDFQQGQGEYLAPECEDLDFNEFKRRRIGRSSDIWSLGCILLELLTYLLKGRDGVREFRTWRKQVSNGATTYRFYSGNGNSHSQVLAWQEELKEQLGDKDTRKPESPKVLEYFLNLVRRMLDISPVARPKAADVEAILRGLAICSLSQDIKAGFEDIASHVSYCPLQEMRRFESWLAICKVDYSLEDPDFTKSWLGRSFSEFRTIISELHQLRDLLRKIKAFFQDQSKRKSSEGRFYRQLNLLNNALIGILPSEKQVEVEDHFVRAMLASPSWKYLEELFEKSEVLHQGDLLSRLANIKLWHDNIEKQKRRQYAPIIGRLDIPQEGQSGNIVKVDYSGAMTLLERKPLRNSMIKKNHLDILQKRLESMMMLLQEANQLGFPVLNCRGVYHDPEELTLGLLYDYPHNPKSGAPFHDHTTLAAILERGQSQLPLLGDRFKLAYNLAGALHRFLKISWLHRNVRASNIAFFHDENLLWERPSMFFLGFAHSRYMIDKEYTEGPPEDWDDNYYLDPNYVFSQRFKPYHDHYALGIVLLEIGFWKSLRDVCSDFLKKDRLEHRDFRKHALEVLVPQLGINMGAIYRDVVRICLDGDGELRDGFTEAEDDEAEEKEKRHLRLHQKLKELVVDKLARLSAID